MCCFISCHLWGKLGIKSQEKGHDIYMFINGESKKVFKYFNYQFFKYVNNFVFDNYLVYLLIFCKTFLKDIFIKNYTCNYFPRK